MASTAQRIRKSLLGVALGLSALALVLGLDRQLQSAGAGHGPGTLSAPAVSAPPTAVPSKLRAGVTFGRLPLSFEENRGQTDPTVKYLLRGGGHVVFLKPNEAVISLHRPGKGSRHIGNTYHLCKGPCGS